jgi:hypothetical protein
MPLLPPVTTATFSFNVMIVPHYALAHRIESPSGMNRFG